MNLAQEQYNLWRETLKDNPAVTKELTSIAEDSNEILERFHMNLEFGTAGLRGILGMGTNRMNIYTVGRATQGLADYLNETVKHPSVAIAYDSRNFSKEFAHHAATIFAANGVTAHVYPELVPTPALSYAIRELKCDSGINITASHNPAQYNGYKAYGNDGCQLSTEASDRVMAISEQVDMFHDVKTMDFNEGVEQGLIKMIPDEFIDQFINRVFKEALEPEVCQKAGLKVVYTPLYGAGNRCVRTILSKAGIEHLVVVKEQELPNGNFPTAPYPNPEMKEALTLGLELAKEKTADILIATDPDCDRLGVAVNHKDNFQILTGNEVGVLLLHYIIETRTKLGKMPAEPFTIRTIVTTKLADAVANKAGVTVRPTLTGFKHIGAIIFEEEQKGKADNYIFGFEESCGYLSGSYVRDKDAVNAALLTAEMASAYKLQGKTLVDILNELEDEFGIYHSYTQNIAFEGVDGMDKMASIMDTLRNNPPKEIAGDTVNAYVDYQTSIRYYNGKEEAVAILPSDVLEFEMPDNSSILIRPSGTEPKIKVYYLLKAKAKEAVLKLEEKYVTAFSAIIGV